MSSLPPASGVGFGFNPSPHNAPGVRAGTLAPHLQAAAQAQTRSKVANSLAAVDAARAATPAAARDRAAAAAAAARSAAAAHAPSATAAPAPAAASSHALEYPTPPTDTRRLLAFLLRQDYGCHGPLLASAGAGSAGAAQALSHFHKLRDEEAVRRKSMSGAVAAAKAVAPLPPLPDAPFPLLRPSPPGASSPSAAAPPLERVDFFTPLHAFRFEQSQQMSLATLLDYYVSIWPDVVRWYLSVACKGSGQAATVAGEELLPPTMHDVLAALHTLFGGHQFVLVHPEAPTAVHPQARRLLVNPAQPLWQKGTTRALTEAELFQSQHRAAYLHPTNTEVDTLAHAPAFKPWLERQKAEQQRNPAYAALLDKPRLPKAVTANALAAAHFPTVAAPAVVAAPAQPVAATPAARRPAASTAAAAASSRSPFLAPTSAAIASMLRAHQQPHNNNSLPPQYVPSHPPAVATTQQSSQLPPPSAAAKPRTSTTPAPASVPTPVTAVPSAPASPAPAPAAASATSASTAPRPGSKSTWLRPLKEWLERCYEPIPASAFGMDAAVPAPQPNLSAAASMFFVDTQGADVIMDDSAAASPAAASIATPAASSPTPLEQHSPSASVIWKSFSRHMGWTAKRPKAFAETIAALAQEIWGTPPQVGGSFLFGNKTLKLQRKAGTESESDEPEQVQEDSATMLSTVAADSAAQPTAAPVASAAATVTPSAAASSAPTVPVAAASSSAVADSVFHDLPPLETSSGETVPTPSSVPAPSLTGSSVPSPKPVSATPATAAPAYTVGAQVDCRDLTGRWVEAEVLDVQMQPAVDGKPPSLRWLIGYVGWSSKWNEWLSSEEMEERVAPRYTHVTATHADAPVAVQRVKLSAKGKASPAAVAEACVLLKSVRMRSRQFMWQGDQVQYSDVLGLVQPHKLNPLGVPDWHHSNPPPLMLQPTAVAELVARAIPVLAVWDGRTNLPDADWHALFGYIVGGRAKMKRAVFAQYLSAAADALGIKRVGEASLGGYAKRNNIIQVLNDTKLALRTQMGPEGDESEPLAAAAAVKKLSKAERQRAKAAAAKAATLVQVPTDWCPMPPTLLDPTLENPLGLTPQPQDGEPRSLSAAVVTEVLQRWLRVAYEPKGSTSVQSLWVQLCRDVPPEFGFIRKERMQELLPAAAAQAWPNRSTVPPTLTNAPHVPVYRKLAVPCITSKLPTRGEVARLTRALGLQNVTQAEAGHGAASVPDVDTDTGSAAASAQDDDVSMAELDDEDGPSADHTARPPPSKKQKGSSGAATVTAPAAAPTDDASSAAAAADATTPASTSVSLDEVDPSPPPSAELSKVIRKMASTVARIAVLAEQEKALLQQAAHTRERMEAKQRKLKKLVQQEKELRAKEEEEAAERLGVDPSKKGKGAKRKQNPVAEEEKEHEAAPSVETSASAEALPQQSEASESTAAAPATAPVLPVDATPAPVPAAAAGSDDASMEPAAVPELHAALLAELPIPELPPINFVEESADVPMQSTDSTDAPATTVAVAEEAPIPAAAATEAPAPAVPAVSVTPAAPVASADPITTAAPSASSAPVAPAAAAISEATPAVAASADPPVPEPAAVAAAEPNEEPAAPSSSGSELPAAPSPSGGALTPFASPDPAAASSSDAVPAGAPVAPPAPVSIRMGRASDAAALSSFARAAFISAFGAQNTPSDMDAYLTTAFSPEIQESELLNPVLAVFIAEREGAIVGYGMTRDEPAPECVSDRTALEVQRVYGVGVGAALLARCLEHALWLGKRTTWLGVWEKNVRAIEFYKRFGGQDLQHDRVMQRSVDPCNPPPLPAPKAGSAPLDSEAPFEPLPLSETIQTRVMHAFSNAPRSEPEKEHGCSVLQVACKLRLTEEEVQQAAAALVEQGSLKATRDAQHYKPV